MTEILRYIIEYCSFLFAPNRFRFVDSLTSESFGGDAYLILESDSLRLRFVRDRGQLFMDFHPVEEVAGGHWFSLEVVQRLLTNEVHDTEELSPPAALFLAHHIDEIERRFSGDRVVRTVRDLKALERLRAKEIFG